MFVNLICDQIEKKMCSVSRNLFRLNKILLRSSISNTEVSRVSSRLLHVNERLLNSENDKFGKLEDSGEVMSSENEHNLAGIITPKYKVFRDEDAPIIFDVDEEMEKINLEEINAPYEAPDIYEGLNLERGLNGVYDIEDLVELLRQNNLMDLFVASVPSQLVYVDHIVIVTARSAKHMKATAEFVRRVFKKKKHTADVVPKIEGKNSHDWIALDLGNIVLHIFSQQARKIYDLDTLWSVGSEYDEQSNVPLEKLSELLTQHSYLSGLQPAEMSS